MKMDTAAPPDEGTQDTATDPSAAPEGSGDVDQSERSANLLGGKGGKSLDEYLKPFENLPPQPDSPLAGRSSVELAMAHLVLTAELNGRAGVPEFQKPAWKQVISKYANAMGLAATSRGSAPTQQGLSGVPSSAMQAGPPVTGAAGPGASAVPPGGPAAQ